MQAVVPAGRYLQHSGGGAHEDGRPSTPPSSPRENVDHPTNNHWHCTIQEGDPTTRNVLVYLLCILKFNIVLPYSEKFWQGGEDLPVRWSEFKHLLAEGFYLQKSITVCTVRHWLSIKSFAKYFTSQYQLKFHPIKILDGWQKLVGCCMLCLHSRYTFMCGSIAAYKKLHILFYFRCSLLCGHAWYWLLLTAWSCLVISLWGSIMIHCQYSLCSKHYYAPWLIMLRY